MRRLAILALALPLGAQTLEQEFRKALSEPGPLWIGYTVPSEPGHYGDGHCCCRDSLRLEPYREVQVLYRIEQGKVTKIRLASPDCRLDTADVPLRIIASVKPAESIAWLSSAAVEQNDSTLSAIANHTDPAALEALLRLAKSPTPRTREKALFWLAHKAGERAVAAITDAVRNDPQVEVKKKAVFALSQLPRGEGVPLLIQVARNNGDGQVRKQAMFWLGQSKDPRAVTFFEEVLR